MDVSALTKMAKNEDSLLPQPLVPKYKLALVQFYVPSHPFGGTDKNTNGNRNDSAHIANGMISANMSCQLIHYVPSEHNIFFKVIEKFDAIILRCNPGQINAGGGDQTLFDECMRLIQKKGICVWPPPDVMEIMGSKSALGKIYNMMDIMVYHTREEFELGFRKTISSQPRVIKQNRGSSGEGIWVVKLRRSSSDYANVDDRICLDDDILELIEACDNHMETHTFREFIDFCSNDRDIESNGQWASTGIGGYLKYGALVDQRFFPRIVEGEVRFNMVGDTCVGIIHKKPAAGGISAVRGTGSVYTYFTKDAPEFSDLWTHLSQEIIPTLMERLGLSTEPLPLWWSADFINSDPGEPGTPCRINKWVISEINCSCLGVSQCMKSGTGNGDLIETAHVCQLIAQKALQILNGK